ncbi:hypothetical protein HanPSC8_Chr09g0360721 [Helianthus annuus]|nr:hypothetical protein HanPSC8_Chr09g0360721 [Helianthus annuus]
MASRAQSWVLQDHILRESGICGMDSDYVCALACLRDTIPSFDFSGFTNKDTAPPKAQHALASALFSKIVHEIEVQQKPFLSVSEHHMHKISFLLYL